MGKNVAKQLVEELSKAGIKHLYAVAGDSLNYVNHEISISKDVEWVHVRHEESGAFAASAEAYLTGIGCCAGSSGPGHVHLINGLYDANHSNLPVVTIASTCPSSELGTDYFQSTNTIKLFDDCSCYNEIANDAKQFSRIMPIAIRNAITKSQVSVVGLPGDLAALPAVETDQNLTSNIKKPYIIPSKESIDDLVKMINESKKITLFCGIGATDAHDELIELSNKIKAPIAYSFRGKMGIEYDNPNAVGMTGLLGVPSGYISMHDADMLLMLGTDFPYTSFIPDHCRIAQVDIRPERIGRRANIELAIAGDVKQTLKKLIPKIESRSDSDFLDYCTKGYLKVKEDLAGIANDKGKIDKISPEYLTFLIDNYSNQDAIFTVDTGMCCTWAARFINATKGRDMLASYTHGSMCNALPMSIGAAISCPDRQVVAMCGDGGLSMILGELATVVQYNLPIKIIVFNNHSLGMVKLEMEVVGLPYTQTDMVNPDFSAVATAMGIKSYKVTDPELLEQTIKEALSYDGAVLIDVHTNSDAIAMPPKITTSQIRGFSMSMGHMLLSGDKKKLTDTIRSIIKRV